jgi:hypothetical protein
MFKQGINGEAVKLVPGNKNQVFVKAQGFFTPEKAELISKPPGIGLVQKRKNNDKGYGIDDPDFVSRKIPV